MEELILTGRLLGTQEFGRLLQKMNKMRLPLPGKHLNFGFNSTFYFWPHSLIGSYFPTLGLNPGPQYQKLRVLTSGIYNAKIQVFDQIPEFWKTLMNRQLLVA